MPPLRTSPRAEHSDVAESIAEPRRIAGIFRALTRFGTVGRIASSGEPLSLVARDPAREDAALAASPKQSLRWAYAGAAWAREVAVEIGGPLSLYRFSLECTVHAPALIVTPLPLVVLRVRSRREPRVQAPPRVFLRLAAGDGGDGWTVRDVSRSGLSFAIDPGDAFAWAGAIADAVIEWQGRLRVCARVHVRHVSEHAKGEGRVAGAKLTFASPEDELHWSAEVDALLDPTTRSGGTWTRDLWELFESSGYFTLSRKSPADFARLRDAFAASSRKLARTPELGTQIVWPSARGVEASASVIALNRSAVFLYHLARRSGAPPAGLTGRELVYAVHARALAWIHARPAVRWLVVWVQDVAQFSKRAHLDFIERNADGEIASVVKMRALEVPVHPPTSEACRIPGSSPDSAIAPEWNVRDAAGSDAAAIASAARAHFPPSFVAAHALDAPLELRVAAGDETSLRRGREVIVAERAGRLEAAAVLEWSEDGVHLFGLLDVLRVIAVGEAAAEAVPILVAHARRRFAHLGKSVFVFTCDPEWPQAQWPEGSKDLGLTHCTVMSTDLVPALSEHAWEVIMGAPR